MSSLFEAGPWDNAEAVAGVHVFDKKRKLLYGDEHDRAAHAEDPSAYSAPREEHRLHPLWRRGASQRRRPPGAWPARSPRRPRAAAARRAAADERRTDMDGVLRGGRTATAAVHTMV